MLKTFREWARGGILAGLVTAAMLLSAVPASAQFEGYPPLNPISYWSCTYFYWPISSGVISTSGLGDPSNVDFSGIGWGNCQFLAVCYPQIDPATGQVTGVCN
jgi:hypothetical protein